MIATDLNGVPYKVPPKIVHVIEAPKTVVPKTVVSPKPIMIKSVVPVAPKLLAPPKPPKKVYHKPVPPPYNPRPVFDKAESMIDTSPPYAAGGAEGLWCWIFVEDVLKQSSNGISSLEWIVETQNPMPGDIVYFQFPNYAHVAIYEAQDADWIYVIDGNGKQSGTLVKRDRYPRANLDKYYKSMN
jgi:hypothetical protein